MGLTFEQLKSELGSLSASERAELAQFLLASLDDVEGDEAEIEAEWRAVAADRLRQIRSGQVTGNLATDVFRRLKERYS